VDLKSRPKESSQGAKEGTPSGLPCGFLGEEKEKCTAAIKQKINQEESIRMWYVIKKTTKDLQSPSVLKVQRVINSKTH
jgi:hypothetical protein